MRDLVSRRGLADVAHSRVWSRLHGRATLVRPAAARPSSSARTSNVSCPGSLAPGITSADPPISWVISDHRLADGAAGSDATH